jgi:hypothetical protein
MYCTIEDFVYEWRTESQSTPINTPVENPLPPKKASEIFTAYETA